MRCVWWEDMEGLCLGGDRLLRYFYPSIPFVLFMGGTRTDGVDGDLGGL